jgi:hypothetical protein
MEYYVFNTEQEAIAAEAWISQQCNMPITGVDAKDGTPQPEKQKTERWAIPQQRLDDKWVFPKVSDDIAIKFGMEAIQFFQTNFNYALETYSEDWFETGDNYL